MKLYSDSYGSRQSLGFKTSSLYVPFKIIFRTLNVQGKSLATADASSN